MQCQHEGGSCEFFLSCWMTNGLLQGTCGGVLRGCCHRIAKSANSGANDIVDLTDLPHKDYGPVTNDPSEWKQYTYTISYSYYFVFSSFFVVMVFLSILLIFDFIYFFVFGVHRCSLYIFSSNYCGWYCGGWHFVFLLWKRLFSFGFFRICSAVSTALFLSLFHSSCFSLNSFVFFYILFCALNSFFFLSL